MGICFQWEKYLSKRSLIKLTCSIRDKSIILWTLNTKAKTFLRICGVTFGKFNANNQQNIWKIALISNWKIKLLYVFNPLITSFTTSPYRFHWLHIESTIIRLTITLPRCLYISCYQSKHFVKKAKTMIRGRKFLFYVQNNRDSEMRLLVISCCMPVKSFK